jgi:ATP-dependent protease ClpP protease subunit
MYRGNYKRKIGRPGTDDDKDKLAETFAEGFMEKLLGGESSNKKHKGISNIFNSRHTNEEVYRENNHIYFRTDVTVENVDLLLQLVREFEDEVKEFKTNPYANDDNFTQPNLYIHLTTYGGDLYAAFLTYDSLKQSKSNIVTIAEGYVASAGTVMMLGGSKRKIQKSTVMMIHQLRTVIGGKFNEIEEDFRNSKMDMKRLVELYHRELEGKMTKKELNEVLTHDIWWDSQMCIKKGLCHEII